MQREEERERGEEREEVEGHQDFMSAVISLPSMRRL